MSRRCVTSLPLLVTLAASASAQQAPPITFTLESVPITVRTDMALPSSRACQAEVSLSYAQKNHIANVEGEIINTDCAASSGNYTIAVSIRDANGATQTLEFPETWQRADDAAFIFESDYPIGANVDLLRVRTRRISCTCAEAPVAGE